MDTSNDAPTANHSNAHISRGQDTATDSQTGKAVKAKARSRRKAAQAVEDDDSSKRRCVSTACIACRKRKSKCDGNTPACAACSQVYGTDCIYDPNSDHRRKGVYKSDADNLKTKDSTIHTLIQAILNYSEEDVPALVQDIRTCESLDDVAERIIAKEHGIDLDDEMEEDGDATAVTYALSSTPTFESNLYGKMGDLRLEEGVVRYIGGTSNLIHIDETEGILLNGDQYPQQENAILSWTQITKESELVTHLLNMYFTWHYTYFATLSKSLFYRDFQLGRPPMDIKRTQYCSPILVNAMLALGCHFTAHAGAREVADDSATAGDHFFREAKRLLMEDDVLELPKLTTVQALALMSVREAGCGREAKGWVYSGMSFRMAQDMGLHLDSGQLTNNSHVSGDDAEDDARKITFWGCFLFDKCWSNYLGRLPQLLRSTVTTSKFEVFPEEDAADWMPYTDSGFTLAHSQPARTRAVALELAKLCEISNDLMQMFYNPTDMDRMKGKQAELKKLSDIHTRLESWRRELPKEFEPKEGGLSSVLVMHMFFQLLFIHLFRPFLKYTQSTSPLPSNNARRDIIHGVKHLEEIAEGWLGARRSLGILSVLAVRWNVQLPYEAETVLTRTDAKFGAYKRDGQSPNVESNLKQQQHSRSRVYDTANPSASMPQQALPSTYTGQTQPQGIYGPGDRYSSAVSPTTAVPQAEEQQRSAVSRPVQTIDSMMMMTGMLPTQHHQRPKQLQHSSIPREATSTPHSAHSPSAMFGGIEQLLRDSQDWAYKDQAQLGTGFGNWTGLEGDSTSNSWADHMRPDSSTGVAQANATMQHTTTTSPSDATTMQHHHHQQQQQHQQSSPPFATTQLPAPVVDGRDELTPADWTHSLSGVHAANMYNTMMNYNEDDWYQ